MHERLFRLLLRVFPWGFRERWADEMTELFRARLARARTQGGALRVGAEWVRTMTDVLAAAGTERFDRTATPPHGEGRMGTLLQDLGYAARRLARAPLFTLASTVVLAVGIGANAAAFSAVDALLFRPPPYASPEEVVSVYQDSDEGEPSSTAYPAYLDIARETDVFAAVGAVAPAIEAINWESPDGPRRLTVEYATASYLPQVLGLEPSRGRWFTPEEDRVGAGLVAVVSARAWRSFFGADPAILGRSVRLNGQPVTVVGVGPERFNGNAGALVTDLWLSISSTPVGGPFRVANLERRADHWYQVKARLAPGVPLARARAEMDALALRMGELYPEFDRGRSIRVYGADEVRLHPSVDGVLFRAGTGLLAVVGLVLLLACSNLANLILVRGAARAPEMAVRRALGASGERVARLFLAEALLLAALGGVAGLLLARLLVALLPLLPIHLPGAAALDLSVDARVTAFCVALALGTGVIFGLAPALRGRSADLAGAMREESRSASPGRRPGGLRRALVGVQVAISLVLLMGAALAARSLARMHAVDPGFDPAPFALLATDLQQAGVQAGELQVVRDRLLARIAALPRVESVAFTTRAPAEPGGSTSTLIEGYEPESGTGAVELAFARVGRGYFETIGLPLLAGRTFGPDDGADAPQVVIVNETAARRFWGGDALGKRLRPQSATVAWRTVVGVVADATVLSLDEPPTPMMYYAADEAGLGAFTLVVRSAADPAALLQPLRAELAAAVPGASATRLVTMDEHLGGTLAEERALAGLLSVFSLFAIVLASLGVYAMVAVSVAARAAELGVRRALGAGRARLVAMVVGEALVPVLGGLGVGVAATLAAGPFAAGILFGLGPRDPVTFGGATLLLVLVGTVAAFVPAWRAASQPSEALRAR